jgi:hypothetical protein
MRRRGWILAIPGALLAALASRSLYRMFLVVRPAFLPDPYAKGTLDSGVLRDCNVPMEHVRQVDNVHSFREVSAMLSKGWYNLALEPVLFKRFLKQPDSAWKRIVDKHAEAPLLFSEVEELSFGNMWLPGIRPFGKVESTLHEVVSEATAEGEKSFFASFLPFLDEDSARIVLNMTKEEYKSIITDTNFVSNFRRTTLATAIHSAVPANSYGVQLAGKKLWLFMPPHEMEKFNAINVGPTIPFSGSEVEAVHSMGKYIVAVQEEGDLLFFPPQWGHAVVTKAGVNVMCNIRETAILKSLATNFWKVPEAIFAKLYLDGFTVFNHARLNEAQAEMKRRMLQKYSENPNFIPPESGCKQNWIDMLEAEK